MNSNWQDQLINLLYTGNMAAINMQIISMLPYPQEIDIDLAMSLLEQGVVEAPLLVLDHLTAITVESKATGMVRIALACLLSKVHSDFFQNPGNLTSIHFLLTSMNCNELKELTDLLKSKSFGKGLGSRPQKLIRKTMESWSIESLKTSIITEATALYSLIRLIHPRYHGSRAKIIKELLNKNNGIF